MPRAPMKWCPGISSGLSALTGSSLPAAAAAAALLSQRPYEPRYFRESAAICSSSASLHEFFAFMGADELAFDIFALV